MVRPAEDYFNKSRLQEDASWLQIVILILYIPFGLLLVTVRTLLGPTWAIVYHGILPRHWPWLRPFIVRYVAMPIFGYGVNCKGREHFDSAQRPFIIVSNHISDMEQNVFRSLTDCTVLTRVTLPYQWVYDWMEFIHVGHGDATTKERVKAEIRSQIASCPTPLYVFSEGGTTNGRVGLLQYQKFMYSLDVNVVPVAMSVSNWLPINLDHLSVHPSFWGVVGNMIWMSFVPWKTYNFEFLPVQTRKDGESDIEFARRVQQLTAATLGLEASEYTYKDKRAIRDKLHRHTKVE